MRTLETEPDDVETTYDENNNNNNNNNSNSNSNSNSSNNNSNNNSNSSINTRNMGGRRRAAFLPEDIAAFEMREYKRRESSPRVPPPLGEEEGEEGGEQGEGSFYSPARVLRRRASVTFDEENGRESTPPTLEERDGSMQGSARDLELAAQGITPSLPPSLSLPPPPFLPLSLPKSFY